MGLKKHRNCRLCDSKFKPLQNNQWYCESCPSDHNYGSWSLNYKRRLSKLCYMAKNRAQSKNLPFNLDKEYLIKLWEENDGCCALTGLQLDLNPYGKKGQVNPQAPSVDRIIPSLGYIKGNIRLITYHMNVSLSEFGIEEFEKLIKHYKEYS